MNKTPSANLFDTDEEEQQMVKMDQEGAVVISEDVSKALGKKKLSPSTITSVLENCPASWLAGSFVLPNMNLQKEDNPARRGSMFHKIMEDFFTLDKEHRTKKNMILTVNKVVASEEFNDFATNEDAIIWLKEAVNNYYRMGVDENPQNVDIAKIIVDSWGKASVKDGLEVFVTGKIGNAERETLGFIDRLKEVSRKKNSSLSEKVFVEDWKTGSKTHRYKPNSRKKVPDGLAEQRQQVIYSMLLEEKYGVDVVGARLIYPLAREIVDVDLTDEKLRSRVVEDVENADAKLTNCVERNCFDYNPGILCSWCPLFNICPAARSFPRVQKAVDAAALQPAPSELEGKFKLGD